MNEEFALYLHINTGVCGANQWTGFYVTTVSLMKELSKINSFKY